MLDNPRSRVAVIHRLLATAYARDRLAQAYYEILQDGLSFGPRDLPRAEDREWLRGAIAVPIQRATDGALDAISVELGRALTQAPENLIGRLSESRRMQEVGWD